jgi:hypothetical protein
MFSVQPDMTRMPRPVHLHGQANCERHDDEDEHAFLFRRERKPITPSQPSR